MEILKAGAQAMGLSLNQQHLGQFEIYYQELTSWNERFNLTAITGYQEVQRRHFLDSLSCLLAFPVDSTDSIPDTVPLQRISEEIRCLDVGTGAGFPGVPLKILLPDIHLTLLESTTKKINFLHHLVKRLDLTGVDIVRGRAEEVARDQRHRECHDVVVARAVAHMSVLAEYCLPFCRLGGRLIAPKGEDAAAEAKEAQPALEELGGRLVAVKPIDLPNFPPKHHLVLVDKARHTPERYPRRTGIPAKRPLPE